MKKIFLIVSMIVLITSCQCEQKTKTIEGNWKVENLDTKIKIYKVNDQLIMQLGANNTPSTKHKFKLTEDGVFIIEDNKNSLKLQFFKDNDMIFYNGKKWFRVDWSLVN